MYVDNLVSTKYVLKHAHASITMIDHTGIDVNMYFQGML
jgi:hypothetical protein